MTESQVFELLNALGIPVAYDHFDEKTTLPFVVYRESGIDKVDADNFNYFTIKRFEIDLCTEKKDVVLEAMLETLLNENEIPFGKDSNWIPSERMYQITYNI